jgi:hypothetical protein
MDLLLAAEATATRRILWMLLEDYELEQAMPEVSGHPLLGPICADLRRGKVPTQATLMRLSGKDRYSLRLEACTQCGLRRMEIYVQPRVLRRVQELIDMKDEGHYCGGFLYSVLTLVLSTPPSEAMVERLTNSYSNARKNLERVHGFLEELMGALLERYSDENGINWEEVLDE